MKTSVKNKMEHYEENTENNEQYSRRHSIRLTGIEKKKQKETPDDTIEKNYEEMDALINKVEIDQVYRSGTKYQDESGKGKQPVLLKLDGQE